MNRRIALASFGTLVASSAAVVAKQASVVNDDSESAEDIRSRWYLESINEQLKTMSLVPLVEMFQFKAKGERRDTLEFDSSAAITFATNYCNSTCPCGKNYDEEGGDCAHFVSHCLAAGGVGLTGSTATCPQGLFIRADELAAAFYNATQIYSNVSQLSGFQSTTAKDFGFLRSWIIKTHAFLLNGAVESTGTAAPIFGHSNNRCGERVEESRFADAVYYRIS
jgi:hypothetical protein